MTVEVGGEFRARLVEEDAHGVLGQVELIGDLLVTEFIETTQAEDFGLTVGQPGDGLAEGGGQFVGLRFADGIGLRAGQEVEILGGVHTISMAHAAELIEGADGGDAAQESGPVLDGLTA